MKKLIYLIGNALAAFMDFAVGTLIATFVAILMSHPLSWWEPLVAGAVFSLLPDYDILWPILYNGITGRNFKTLHHESLLHWPVLVLGVVTPIVWVGFGPYWGITAFLCILAHYIHDASVMGKDAVGWLVRLKRPYWESRGGVEPADPDHDHWIEVNWLRPSKLSMIEIFIGSSAIGFASGLTSWSWHIPLLAFAAVLPIMTTWVFLSGTWIFWVLCRRLKYT